MVKKLQRPFSINHIDMDEKIKKTNATDFEIEEFKQGNYSFLIQDSEDLSIWLFGDKTITSCFVDLQILILSIESKHKNDVYISGYYLDGLHASNINLESDLIKVLNTPIMNVKGLLNISTIYALPENEVTQMGLRTDTFNKTINLHEIIGKMTEDFDVVIVEGQQEGNTKISTKLTYKDKTTNEYNHVETTHNVKITGKQIDFFKKFFKKDSVVRVVGIVQNREFTIEGEATPRTECFTLVDSGDSTSFSAI